MSRRGHVVDAPVWDDPSIDWTTYDAVILRQTWDYYRKPQAFREWIDLEVMHTPTGATRDVTA